MSERTRVLILRPEGQSDEMVRLLEERGCEVTAIPAIEITELPDLSLLDSELENLAERDIIIFTSVNGVEACIARMPSLKIDPMNLPCAVGVIGPGTAAAAQRGGMTVDWMPTRFTTESLAEELPDDYHRPLLVRADIATPELEERLRGRGFDATRVDAYGTRPINQAAIRQAVEDGVQLVLATSASVARSFAGAISGRQQPIVLSIGPATTLACSEAGLQVASEASEHTVGGLLGCLDRYLRN